MPVVVKTKIALNNFVRLKSRDTYTRKVSIGCCCKVNTVSNSSSNNITDPERVATGKQYLGAKKKSKISAEVCHWTSTSQLVFEDKNRIIKFLNCVDDKLFSSCKIQPGL